MLKGEPESSTSVRQEESKDEQKQRGEEQADEEARHGLSDDAGVGLDFVLVLFSLYRRGMVLVRLLSGSGGSSCARFHYILYDQVCPLGLYEIAPHRPVDRPGLSHDGPLSHSWECGGQGRDFPVEQTPLFMARLPIYSSCYPLLLLLLLRFFFTLHPSRHPSPHLP